MLRCAQISWFQRVVSSQAILLCAALVTAPSAFAQNAPAKITALSVLTMAKDLAETEPKRGIRASLRSRVVQTIRDTGQEAAFRDYVADVSADTSWSIPASVRNDPVWQRNRELEAEAKALFLAGDVDGARQQLRQCQFIPHYDSCLTDDYFLQFQFLHWELAAHDLPAALRRFRANDWRSLRPAVALRLARR